MLAEGNGRGKRERREMDVHSSKGSHRTKVDTARYEMSLHLSDTPRKPWTDVPHACLSSRPERLERSFLFRPDVAWAEVEKEYKRRDYVTRFLLPFLSSF